MDLKLQWMKFYLPIMARISNLFSRKEEKKVIGLKDWQIDCGPFFGKKGEVKWVEVFPQVDFFGEKLMATDFSATSEDSNYEENPKNGLRTKILLVIVGMRLQKGAIVDRDTGKLKGTITSFFAQNAFGNGTRWDLCEVGQSVKFLVEFLEDSKWECTVFGKARIPG